MDDLFTASKEGHAAITVAKNGKKYANIVIWLNETPDQYGKIGSVQLSQQKDSQEKKVYVGNINAPKDKAGTPVEIVNTPNDLPF